MSWGYKITFLYTGFAVLILGMVFASVKYNKIHLVTKNYYEQEVLFNEKAIKISNTQSLEKPVQINYQIEDQLIRLNFPELEGISGNIKLYRPSNSKKDKDFAIQLSDFSQEINVVSFTRGQWKVLVDWEANGKKYYQQKLVIL
ncbi:MAG: FixH family protein [Bacteroidia bacterium]|nr:FixH family protein [Bacteroidia bacterium]